MAYDIHEDTKIKSVCDESTEAVVEFQKIYSGTFGTTDYKNMDHLDIISICTPTSTHAPIIDHIVDNKLAKAIFCEKPLAYSGLECRRLIDKCKNANITLAVNFMRRWDALYIQLANTIKEKQFGELISVVGYTNTALYMNASHMIDLITWLCGDIGPVWGSFRNDFVRKVEGISDPGGIFHFRTDNNVDGMLYAYCNDVTKHQFELDLQFSEGRIIVGDDGGCVSVQTYKPSNKITGMKELSSELYEVALSERMLNAVSNLVDSLTDDKVVINCTGEDAIKTTKFIEKCYYSNDKGGVVWTTR